MLVRLYRVVVGVVPAPPEDVNTSKRLQGFLAMSPDLALSWTREQRRGFSTRLDTTALVSADRGAGEVVHSAPGLALGADRAPCAPGSAWATHLACLPDCLFRDPAVRYDAIISAPVIRAPIEDGYPGWLSATVSRVKALAVPPAYPNLLHMPIPVPYLRKLPSMPPSSHANSEQRARRRGFLISWNQQEFWRLPPVMRTQFFAAAPTWLSQMETPIGFTTGGSLVAYYDRDEMYRSCRDAHSVMMAIWVTEYLVMARNRLYEEARDGSFWMFSGALFGWIKQLEPEELDGGNADALDFFQAMLALRAALPVQDQAFHDAVRRLDTSRRDRDGWLTVVTRNDTDGVRIVIQDPLDAAAYSISASRMAVPPEAPLCRAQAPLASVGVPSGWASAVAQRTGGSGSSPYGGLPLPGHQLVPPPRASLLANPVTLATTAPSSRADPATPVVSTVARVATANRLPLAPPVPDSLLSDTSATLSSEGEAWLERLFGRLRGASAGFPTSVLLVSLVDLLGSLSNDLFTWAETHPVGDPEALEAVLQWWSRAGVNDQLWSLFNIHQQRQENHLRRAEQAGTWRVRGSGSGDRREEAAGDNETWYRDAPGSPQRGTGGGGNQTWPGNSWYESRPRASTPVDHTRGYGRTYGGQDGPSGYEGPSATRRRLD